MGVSIAAPPTDGEANAELIRYLAEVLDLKKTHVSLEKVPKKLLNILFLKQILMLVFLDLSAAFGTVDRSSPLAHLDQWVGIKETAMALLIC